MYIWMCVCVRARIHERMFTFLFETISGKVFYCALPFDLCKSFNDISCKELKVELALC